MISDLTGRETLFAKDGYGFAGKPHENNGEPLDQTASYNVPLRPQRTVIQFNSTYMELIDRWDRTRGEVIFWFGFFFIGATLLTTMFAYFSVGLLDKLADKGIYFIIFIVLFLISSLFLFFCYKVLRLELFSYRYFPLRFNRKTGKVHVLQAAGKVETFDWANLKIDMLKPRNNVCYVRCCEVDKEDNVKQTFSLPYTTLSLEDLVSHFEFVSRYMKAKTTEDIEEVAETIRYIYPLHHRRSTIKELFERAELESHYTFQNMEKPEESLVKNTIYYLSTPLIMIRFIGRIISGLTSKQPKFSTEIEAESVIDPNDKFDLNKNPPVPELLAPPTLFEQVTTGILFIVGLIFMASIFALVLDLYSLIRPGDYPSFFKGLWDILLLKWL